MPIEPCSTLFSTLKGKRRSLDPITRRRALCLPKPQQWSVQPLQPQRRALQLPKPWQQAPWPLQPRRQTLRLPKTCRAILQLNQRTNLYQYQLPPYRRRNIQKKSVCLAKDEDEPGSSREREEEAEPELGVSLGTLGAMPAAALDPNVTALGEIPQPPIMGNVDPSKIDEIRRTVYVGNLNSQTTTADQLLDFFKQVGEVKFVRMAGDETQPTRFAFVEFADQNSVPRALAFNGVMFGDRPLKINHSNNAIVKPPEMTPQAAAKELEEVMKRVREAQSFISAAIEPESGKSSERKGGRSRSRSRSESRSSSKSRSRRKRSHSKHRNRSGNRSLSRHKDRRRSRSPLKKRSRSRERQKSRSRSHSRATKRLFKRTTQRSAPKLDTHGWNSMWEDMGRYLDNFSPPVAWKFTPEQLQNPHEVVEYLKDKCCGYSKDVQLAALCWALASIYQTLLDIMQHPQGEKGEKMENRTTGTVAAPTMITGTVAAPTPMTDTSAKPENQPVPVSVAPVQKKKHTKKSVRLVRDEDEPGSLREQEEEAEPEIITRSLSLTVLHDMRKDFSRHPSEHIVTWLLRFWDSGASSVELEGKEAKQLGSLSREGGLDKAIGRKTQVLSLWRRLLLGVKERYPFRDEVTCHQGKWTTMERGIQYLRELAVLEEIYNDPENAQSPTDPDEVQCTHVAEVSTKCTTNICQLIGSNVLERRLWTNCG
ncbi:uncharacterized protein LOC126035258 isoform X3 [Accipiter gentilis]|uniref:uncharacterized protein LOC126035258 isoform X2 n=1 Tax=Astur gentilis TaxID=8957 RepID=UPI00210F591B|nr:uncharacterized protein LOC126035258 isoform X2 [Accipiter gentilis]XP_049649569.1 uncharacterized protein LOC126035258 isoform X3 [Accipiter gentilis]